jgi:hypothetical protein
LEVARGPSRATMVLLPKQVHLQKDMGAGIVSDAWLLIVYVESYMQREIVTERRRMSRLPKCISSWLQWQLYSRNGSLDTPVAVGCADRVRSVSDASRRVAYKNTTTLVICDAVRGSLNLTLTQSRGLTRFGLPFNVPARELGAH